MSATVRPQRLRTIRIRDFRNIQSIDWEPHGSFNVLWGDNGQGKSNLLEAIYAVGALRSFRGARPAELVRWGATEASVEARVEEGGATADDVRRFSLHMSSQTGRLLVRVDEKRPASADEYFGTIQMVLFHPGDTELVRGAPEGRRRWLDRLLYQLFPGYADDHRKYLRALRGRNRLFADGAGDAALDAWEATMAPLAARIVKARSAAVTPLGSAAGKTHGSLAPDDGSLAICYEPSVLGDEAVFRSRWAVDRKVDRLRERTRGGPHRDDVTFLLGDQPARGTASQGQQRSISLALKLAEIRVLEGLRHRTPVLLLDDVSSELDPHRNAALFSALSERGAQVFVTTTRREFVLGPKARKDLRILGGTLVPE